jgi:hypothetical protein
LYQFFNVIKSTPSNNFLQDVKPDHYPDLSPEIVIKVTAWKSRVFPPPKTRMTIRDMYFHHTEITLFSNTTDRYGTVNEFFKFLSFTFQSEYAYVICQPQHIVDFFT